MRGAWRAGLCLAVGMLALGCQGLIPRKPEMKVSPSPQARRGPGLSQVETVLVLPFGNESAYPEAHEEVAKAIAEEVTKATGLRMRGVSERDEGLAGIDNPWRKRFTLEELAYLHREFDADAVLQGTVASSQPYPHTALGLRLQMTDLRTGERVWSMEEMWDAGDQGVAGRAQRYYGEEMHEAETPYGWEIVLVSPAEFRHFVAYEVALTLRDGAIAR